MEVLRSKRKFRAHFMAFQPIEACPPPHSRFVYLSTSICTTSVAFTSNVSIWKELVLKQINKIYANQLILSWLSQRYTTNSSILFFSPAKLRFGLFTIILGEKRNEIKRRTERQQKKWRAFVSDGQRTISISRSGCHNISDADDNGNGTFACNFKSQQYDHSAARWRVQNGNVKRHSHFVGEWSIQLPSVCTVCTVSCHGIQFS